MEIPVQYRIKVAWLPDETASRLHPTLRLRSLEITLDKPAPASVVLGDLLEAIEICRTGCDLYGVRIDYQIEGSYLVAVPSKPSQAQLQIGNLLATNFRSKEAKKNWIVAVGLVLERGGREYGNRNPPDWKSRIVTVLIDVVPLVQPEMLLLGSGSGSPVKVGAWAPEAK